MPTCNKVNCAIVLPPTDTPLPEYRCKYLDSSVSVYVPVPDIPILHAAPSFNIHLWTDGYIAPGLAMFVYIDGHYQCNRSKRMPPPGSAGGSGIEMKLRQKEEKIAGGEGDFVGREWRWVHLDVEKANEANNVDRETQDRIGKIEVVVLRCADDELPPVERQMQTLRLEGASKKASEKAPSAKAPSIKPVSAKAPSAAASGGLGGFFGLFDGACDDYSDDASNEDADETLPASQSREAKNYHLPLGLDGQEYEQPQTVFDRYGQPCGVRVPYRRNYDEAIRPEPGQTEHRRNVNANIDYFSTRGVPKRALSGHRPEKRYADAPVLMPFTPNTPQGPKVQQPRGTFAPAGPLYVPVYDQTPPQRPNYNSPAYNYIDPTGRTRYVVRDGVPKSYVDPQPPSYPVQVVEEPLRLPAILDPEFQRFQIFQMPGRIEAMLELDHKFVAASVPHMEQLKTTPIADLSFEDMQNMKRSLHKCLSRGFYPNGDPIKKEFSDPQAHETRSHRPRSRSRHAESSHKNAERSKAGDAGGKVMSWIGKDDQAASKHGKSQSGRGRSPTRSEKPLTISEASWGNNNGGNAQAIGDWNQQNDTSGEQNDGNNNGWGDDNNNQEKATEKSSTVWEFSLAGGGDGNQKKPEHAPASHHSKTSNTTNPHAYIQPYFQTWRSDGRTYTTKPLARQPREPYSYLPAPTPHIPSDQIGDRSHGVRAGKGADYTHKVRRPKYLDTMEDPYAVFVFNYRSAEKLEEILEKDIQADLKVVAEEVGRGVLMTLPREKLVEELLKSQAKAKSGDDGDAKKSGDAKRSKSGKSEGKKAKSAAAPSSHGQKPVNNWATGPSQEAAGQDAGFTPDDAGGKAKSANPGWQAAGEGFTAAEPKGGW